MTIREYKQIVDSTISNVSFYDYHQKELLKNIKFVMDVSYKMKYNNILKTVKGILEKYSTITTGRLGEDKYVTYIVVNAPQNIKETIQNLKFSVEDKQASDISEKIINIR